MNSTESIVERAKQIITRYFPEDIYHVTFDRKEGMWPRTEIVVYNKELPLPVNRSRRPRDFYCIKCEITDEKPSVLHIGLLTRCGLRGATHLDRVIAFSKDCGFSQITLEDESMIMYSADDGPTNTYHFINLQQLMRLMTGQSWYERFGFTNDNIERNIKKIQAHIQQPIHIYPEELIDRIQDTIESELEIKIEPTLSISETALQLYECLKKICPDRKCPSIDDLAVVDDINSILNEMYQWMLSRLNLEESYFRDLHLNLSLLNQKGSSRKHLRKHSRKHSRRTQKKHNKKARKRTHKKF